jgi:hypothetical protein
LHIYLSINPIIKPLFMSMKNTTQFDGNEGQLLPSAETAKLTAAYREAQERGGHAPGSYTEAQFFGRNTINKLMERFGDECVGLRFYFALGEGGQQLVAAAVNAEGRDLTTVRLGGLKDMPDGGDDTMANGPRCPSVCNP